MPSAVAAHRVAPAAMVSVEVVWSVATAATAIFTVPAAPPSVTLLSRTPEHEQF